MTRRFHSANGPLRPTALAAAAVVSVFLVEAISSQLSTSQIVKPPVTPPGEMTGQEAAQIKLFDRVSPSVVQVVGVSSNLLASGTQSNVETVQSGSGFVWDTAGHVVTNNHLVANSRSVAVRLASSRVLSASVVGTAPAYDLAVLSIDSGESALPPPVMLGTSGDLKVGQYAFAIGNPFGIDESLAAGIVSAVQRRLPTSGGREIADAIQTDAAINPGNSGGPLLDSSGRLIGVTSAAFSGSAHPGVGFAIPVDVVTTIVPQIIANGSVPTPGIGILAADENVAARLGVEGVIIMQVARGSPADKIGLKGVDHRAGTIGDVIVAANGHAVKRLADLTEALAEAGVGHDIQLGVSRGGSIVTVAATIADVAASQFD